jgi:serine/threonine protein kinase
VIEAGERVGSYVLEECLGEGATGVVYRAVHEPDGAIVALKVLRPELAGNDTYRARFLREARAAGEVRHSHLVPVLDVGEAEGACFLACAFVAGGSLAARLRKGPLGVDELVRVASGVAGALDVLHAAGIVHRDVKPANVMLSEEGSALLTDFGLAKGRAYTLLTRPGQVLGTLDYLAPELIRGETATPASDLYALGCVVYECATGTPPFAGRGMIGTGMAHLDEQPPDPRVTPQLSFAILQALEKDPARRPRTATAYATMLQVAAR